MREFSIKELERFSGIKMHTIRIWERRYGILNPKRGSGNVRRYTLSDVRSLLNISLLIQNGSKISHLVEMGPSGIEEKIFLLVSEDKKLDRAINQLIICMFASDIENFESILDSCVFTFGTDSTIQKVIIPFLERTQILSYKDTSSEVHFAVTAVRKKLILGIEKTRPSHNSSKTALFFLPKGEHYDLLLLYMSYVIKIKGFRILYLGTNISKENLEAVWNNKMPEYVYMYITPMQRFIMEQYTEFITERLPHAKVFVALSENEEFPQIGQDNVRFFYYKDIGKTLGALA